MPVFPEFFENRLWIIQSNLNQENPFGYLQGELAVLVSHSASAAWLAHQQKSIPWRRAQVPVDFRENPDARTNVSHVW